MALTDAELKHLLRRTEFTARPARVAQLAGLTVEQAVADILDFARNPSDAATPPLRVGPSGRSDIRLDDLVAWWVDRMVSVPRPFAEKMTFFWHGHFTSEIDKVGSGLRMIGQNRMYRSLALGSYRQLVQAMAIDPAMLRYLDNAQNVKASPNQNFARELMELFLLGVGNYTEADVDAMARAWTGHSVDRVSGRYVFRRAQHDFGTKTLFGVARNWDGPATIDYILRDNASLQAIAARLIVKKLWEHFAYPSPAAALVEGLAQQFVASGLDVRRLVTSILTHPEFYSATAKSAIVRPPVDMVVAVLEATGMKPSDLRLVNQFEAMGQTPFNPPNVSGWRSNASWINTSSWAARMTVVSLIAQQHSAKLAPASFVGLSTDEMIDKAAHFARVDLTAASRDAIRQIVGVSTRPTGTALFNLHRAVLVAPEFHIS
jgi:uncharacterized protein (DUF1800 family)